MSITASIRKRPWLLLGMIIIALLAFLINPESMDKMFGQNPNILGKVNGEEITRDEFNDQLSLLQQQSQGQPQQGLEEQAWQILVQSKLIKQQFDKMGLKITDEITDELQLAEECYTPRYIACKVLTSAALSICFWCK